MMNCKQVSELLPLFVAGELDEAVRAELESHANICAECAAALKEAKAVHALAHDALAHFEPGEDFEKEVFARITADASVQSVQSADRPGIRWRHFYPIAVAAAVFIVALVLLQNKPAGTVIAGKLSGEATKIRQGQKYVANQPSAIELLNGAKAFLMKEAGFSIIEDALHLLAGSCYVDSRMSPRQVTRLATAGLFVELHHGEAYLYAGLPVQEAAPHADILDAIMPRAYAEEANTGAPALLVVFSGTAEAVVKGTRHVLGGGEFLFEDETTAGPRKYEAFLKEAGSRIDEVERAAQEIEKRLEPYTHVIASYTTSLAGLKELADTLGAQGGAELEELKVRIALIEQVKTVHEARAGQMLADLNNARGGEMNGLKARVRELEEAEQTRRDALENFGKL